MVSEPELRLWGVPELRIGAAAVLFAAERRYQLLVVLALQPGQWVARDRVAALLWPEHAMADARRNLRKVLFTANPLAGPTRLAATDHALRWTVSTDLQAFADDLREGRRQEALARRAGAPLHGLDDSGNAAFAAWLGAERARIDAEWHAAAHDDLQAQADPHRRLEAARRLLATDPFDEPAVAALLRAQRALGRIDEARAEYRDYAARLAEELGVEPSNALRDIVHGEEPIPARLSTVVSAPTPPGTARLPTTAAAPAAALPDSFIGRRTELAQLAALLARPECRLVTVLGPGGIGKSSLARRALAASDVRFAGGTWWVELQDLRDTTELLARLAQLLGADINDTRDPAETLARHLDGPPVLLVFDNAEHLDQLPALCDRLLAAAPSLCLLVTSRSRLHGEHEWLLPLRGLAVPDDESRDAEAASSFDAVHLFQARASAAQRDFQLEPHLGAVIEIVEAVAGMPLAIELAASWVRLLPAEEIARELRDSIDLLQRDPATRTRPARPEHESIVAVLEQSWKLLTPLERDALAALSVFHGGFTRAAAQRVAAVALPLLSTLADKSLVGTDEEGRFAMHPLIRAHAEKALAEEPPRRAAMRERHAEFFAQHLAALAPHAIGDQRVLQAGVTAEYANCRVAWQHAVAERRADLVYDMVRALWSFFEAKSRYVEGIALLSPGLGLPPEHPAAPRALTRLRHGLSMLHHRKGDGALALALARSGIGPGEDCGDTEAYVGCLLNTAMCVWDAGRPEEALPDYERGLRVAQERQDRHCIMWATGNLGICKSTLGRFDEARDLLEQALTQARELGDTYNTAVNLNNLGTQFAASDRWSEALAFYEESWALCRDFGIATIGQIARASSGNMLFRMGQFNLARVRLEEELAQCRRTGAVPNECAIVLSLARIDIAQSRSAAAWRRLREGLRLARGIVGLERLVVWAVELYGDLLGASGDQKQAAAAWRASLASGALDARGREQVSDKLAASKEQVGDSNDDPAPPSFEELLARIERGPPAPHT
jgi:predicted ATPase/DNA-binding SARP family transcriptional activator